jgi:hypothetical protein
MKLTRSWLSLSLILLLFPISCATSCPKIRIGPALVDKERDLEGSKKRYAEFDLVCVDSKPLLAPNLCAWIQQANKSIRANNVQARD